MKYNSFIPLTEESVSLHRTTRVERMNGQETNEMANAILTVPTVHGNYTLRTCSSLCTYLYIGIINIGVNLIGVNLVQQFLY